MRAERLRKQDMEAAAKRQQDYFKKRAQEDEAYELYLQQRALELQRLEKEKLRQAQKQLLQAQKLELEDKEFIEK